jgi:hypothetical protein
MEQNYRTLCNYNENIDTNLKNYLNILGEDIIGDGSQEELSSYFSSYYS